MSSNNSINLIAGSGITLSNSSSGLTISSSGSGGITSLSKYTSGAINGLNTGTTLLFTTSAFTGNFYVWNILFILTAVSGGGAEVNAPAGTIGTNSSSYNNISGDLGNASSLSSPCSSSSPTSPFVAIPPSTGVNINIGTAATVFTTYMFEVVLYGDVF